MQKVIIFGGTGFIGSGLAQYLALQGVEPIIVGRNRNDKISKFKFVQWDANTIGDWKDELEGVHAIVNLCGRSVDCIKTPENCDLILRSRVDTTKLIGRALKQVSKPPKIWIQMSTAHIYGDPPSVMCTESSSFGYGLAPTVGKAWEKSLLENLPEGTREVRLRTSFVIGKKGGAFPKLKLIAKLGLGGRIGKGTQGLSWLHELDMHRMIYQAILNDNFKGPYIASAPSPVSQVEFMKTLRSQLRMPFGLFTPAFLLKFAAKYMVKTDPNLLLSGRYVKSERIVLTGFQFEFTELKNAIKDLLN